MGLGFGNQSATRSSALTGTSANGATSLCHTANIPERSNSLLSWNAGIRELQSSRHRLERYFGEHHECHRFRREPVPNGLANLSRQWPEPGDLLCDQHKTWEQRRRGGLRSTS